MLMFSEHVKYLGKYYFQTLDPQQLLRTKAIQSPHTFLKDNVNGLLNRGPEHLKVAGKYIFNLKQCLWNDWIVMNDKSAQHAIRSLCQVVLQKQVLFFH